METNVIILKYQRECDSWLCPECDTENNTSLDKCMVCRYKKTPLVTIVRAWSETDEKIVTVRSTMKEPINTANTTTTKALKEDGFYISAEKDNTKIIWGIIIAIIFIIALLIAVFI